MAVFNHMGRRHRRRKNTETTNIFQEAEYPGNNPEINEKSIPHNPQNDENQIEYVIVPKTTNPQQQSEKRTPVQEVGGSRRAHSTESSDSEKTNLGCHK